MRDVSPRAQSDSGFTLIEMMVALLIFGMLASAGVALLSFGVRAQAATNARLDDVAAINRLLNALSADLAQATPRMTRDESGTLVPAFAGDVGGAGPLLRVVRGGWTNLDAAPRASVQKVEYRVDRATLQRTAYPMLDGAEALPPATLLNGVARVALRYRVAGAWSDRWSATPAVPLPQAVEIVIDRSDGTRFRSVMLVGTGYVPPADPQ